MRFEGAGAPTAARRLPYLQTFYREDISAMRRYQAQTSYLPQAIISELRLTYDTHCEEK